eukprot:1178291-Rhodomonas_salina.2
MLDQKGYVLCVRSTTGPGPEALGATRTRYYRAKTRLAMCYARTIPLSTILLVSTIRRTP